MDLFTPYAIDDLMHFTRMGSPANIVLPLLMLASFAGQIFFMPNSSTTAQSTDRV